MNIRLLISVVLVAQLVLAVDDAVEGAVLEGWLDLKILRNRFFD